MEDRHEETLEQAITHTIDEARMLLPGVQAILGFQLIAVFNQRFEELTEAHQKLHLVAFLMLALAMGLLMAPAAVHRQAERGFVSRRLLVLASTLLTVAMLPLLGSLSLDAYIFASLITNDDTTAAATAAAVLVALGCLWFVLPWMFKRHRR